jgi:hypothetical protein
LNIGIGYVAVLRGSDGDGTLRVLIRRWFFPTNFLVRGWSIVATTIVWRGCVTAHARSQIIILVIAVPVRS